MDLRDFVKNVLIDVNAAVDEAGKETSRDIRFSVNENNRTIEFDIAVSAESTDKKNGKAGIQVLQFVNVGGDLSSEHINSSVSRVVFGLSIDSSTRTEKEEIHAAVMERNNRTRDDFIERHRNKY